MRGVDFHLYDDERRGVPYLTSSLPADELLSRPVLDLADLLRSRSVSSAELVRRSLDRIARYDDRFAAFVTRFERRALRTAERIDAEWRRGDVSARPLFAGIPTAIKDLNLLRGAFVRMGTPAFRWLWSPVDDVTVRTLRSAGFVFVGKTQTSELGIMPVTEPTDGPATRNPWDPSRTPGGSSGGAGAAVAASLVPVAHASDGAGSIRIPASLCGLFGHKATRGLLPNPHEAMDGLGMTANGAVTRTALDTAAMLDVAMGRPPGSAGSFLERCRRAPGPLTVGLVLMPPLGATSPEIATATIRIARLLEALGHHVIELGTMTGSLDEFLPIYGQIAASIPVLDESSLQPVTRWLRGVGRLVTANGARVARDALTRRIDRFVGSVDVILSPTVPIPTPSIGAFSHGPPGDAFERAAVLGAFTAPGNLTGRPAISVPAGLVDGMPVGVQLMGKRGSDAVLVALARVIEEAMG